MCNTRYDPRSATLPLPQSSHPTLWFLTIAHRYCCCCCWWCGCVRYTKIGPEAVNSTLGQQLNLESALQSFVILKNNDSTLPFIKGKKTAVSRGY